MTIFKVFIEFAAVSPVILFWLQGAAWDLSSHTRERRILTPALEVES